MVLGVVSNCWSDQLAQTDLAAQCRRALDAGYGYVELRQRALAECDETVEGDEHPWPRPDRLAALAREFPGVGFNLAVELPFMTCRTDPGSPYVRRLAEAAAALGGERVLRLVDVSPAERRLPQRQAEDLGSALAELAHALWQRGIRLALENSRQPVLTLRALIHFAAPELGGAPLPRICWDAGNQLAQQFAEEDPTHTAAALPLEELFEFHFKQARGGVPLTGMEDGDIDWSAIIPTLQRRGFSGPALFEIPPGPDVWERLAAGTVYVRAMGRQPR